jgi:hypothetical protein
LGEQLLATLKGYFPAMIELCGGEVSTRLCCELLLKWPDLESLRRAKPQTLRAFFYARNFRRPDLLEERLAALKAAVALCRDEAIVGAGKLKAQRLARQTLTLLPALKLYDEQIATLFGAHPDAVIFESFPGAGPALAPRHLALFGSRRERWSSSTEVATYSGIAPVIERSGKRCLVHWRWACPKFVRQSLHEFAACSLPFCDWAHTCYQTRARARQNPSQRGARRGFQMDPHSLPLLAGPLPLCRGKICSRSCSRRRVKNFPKIIDGPAQVSLSPFGCVDGEQRVTPRQSEAATTVSL